MNTETLSAQQRLARNRQAMVSHLRGRNQPETFRADDGTVYSADPESPTFSTADGVLPMLKRAAVTWWHFHPARQALLIAEPSLAHYAQRKPWQLMGIAAGVGAATVLLRPWKLLSVSGIALAALRSTEFSSVAMALLNARNHQQSPPEPLR
jgi:hypothetical protein